MSSSGRTDTGPSETTRPPDSSSERNSTSSISSRADSTSLRARSTSAWMSSPGRVAISSNESNRASGVRSSWETAAVNPVRSSSYAVMSPGWLR